MFWEKRGGVPLYSGIIKIYVFDYARGYVKIYVRLVDFVVMNYLPPGRSVRALGPMFRTVFSVAGFVSSIWSFSIAVSVSG